jgi:hypothetical protein
VIWRSILLALDFEKEPGVYEAWSACNSGAITPESFLRERKMLRDVREPSSSEANFYVTVNCSLEVLIDGPFMMEQCLTCLLQNALAASEIDSGSELRFKTFQPIDIDVTATTVEIRNLCSKAFSNKLAEVLNADLTVDEFAASIRGLLSGPAADRPGLGTIVGVLIARECYGGLGIDAGESETRASVYLQSQSPSRWHLGSDSPSPAGDPK